MYFVKIYDQYGKNTHSNPKVAFSLNYKAIFITFSLLFVNWAFKINKSFKNFSVLVSNILDIDR
jgi:hypothetical protein